MQRLHNEAKPLNRYSFSSYLLPPSIINLSDYLN
jgi:hypothetical protein